MRVTWIWILMTLALLSGCKKEAVPEPAVAEPVAPAVPEVVPDEGNPAETIALEAATEGLKSLGQTLKSELMQKMSTGGPSEAVAFCAGNAHGLTQGVIADTGVTVGRSSLRLRNPANAGPDWVQAWLTEQGERPLQGLDGFRRIDVVEGGKKYARVLKPIGIEPVCLNCHGPSGEMQAAIRERLGENYPEDQATGYATGDLRGAIWAEMLVRGAP
jgi:hypothetical protein